MKMALDPMRGLAVSENGLTLDVSDRVAHPNKQLELAFRILGEARPANALVPPRALLFASLQ